MLKWSKFFLFILLFLFLSGCNSSRRYITFKIKKVSTKKTWNWYGFNGHKYTLTYSFNKGLVVKSSSKFGVVKGQAVNFVKRYLKTFLSELRRKGVFVIFKGNLSYVIFSSGGSDVSGYAKMVNDKINEALEVYYSRHGLKYVVENNKNSRIEIDYKKLVYEFEPEFRDFSDALYVSIGSPGDRYKILEGILSFVQSIKYKVPSNEVGKREIYGLFTPWETLYYGNGDCDSKSLLFATLWVNLAPSIPFVFIEYPDKQHLNIGVKDIWGIAGDHVEYKGESYLICECAGGVYKPGENPFANYKKVVIN